MCNPTGLCECGCGQKTRLAPKNSTERGWVKGQPLRFISGHHNKVQAGPIIQRLEANHYVGANGCWVWTGCLNDAGYGVISYRMAWQRVHRLSYELMVGAIPEGLVIDHLCFNRACFNPAHLEPVTDAENVRRAARRITHCPRGHPYSPENTYIVPGGESRQCRICKRLATERYRDSGKLNATRRARRARQRELADVPPS